MSSTISWHGTLTATSSIVHGGDTKGTITLLRRETVVQPDGSHVLVPIISGNSFRGRLRRIGEELLRDTLAYEGLLPLSAAHALRGGGSLAKTSTTPLSGRRLHELRSLVPHVGVFGCAGGGRLVDGCLQVGKVVPHVAETAHIIGGNPADLPAFNSTQIETYVRQDDTSAHSFAAAVTTHRVPVGADGEPDAEDLPPADTDTDTGQLMVYRVETFPAGTTFSTWLRLDRASDLEVAFFTTVLEAFTRAGRLGGRAAIGHGLVDVELTRTILTTPPDPVDWHAHLLEHRDAAVTALTALT